MDILLSDNGFEIKSGDLVVGDASQQHAKLLLFSARGDWKNAHNAGVNILRFVNKTKGEVLMKREIAAQISADGGAVGAISIDDGWGVAFDVRY